MVLRQTTTRLAVIFTLFSYAVGQQADLLSSAPACAQSCGVLTAAQQSCNQQNAGAPLPNIASCFCVSPQVTNLRSDPSVCADSCTSSSDQNNAMYWFANFCAAPQTITRLPGAGATATVAPVSSAATTAAASATNTAVEGNAANAVQYPTNPGSWWDQHSKWIIMVIVLIVGFAIIIALGVYLKRRHNRRRNERSSMPSSAVWGPQQSHPSVDRLGASNSNLDFRHDAEKGAYYQNKPPQTTFVYSDMSGALQPGSSSRQPGQRGSSKHESGGKRLKKLDRVLGRS